MNKDLGIYIRQQRKKKGLNTAQLAKKSGVSRSYISIVENNLGDISDRVLNKILNVLSATEEEYQVHSDNVYKMIGKRPKDYISEYGTVEFDLHLINELAQSFTYKGQPLMNEDIYLIKKLAQTLADKNRK